jgi:hypothetical protein
LDVQWFQTHNFHHCHHHRQYTHSIKKEKQMQFVRLL